MSTGTKHRTPPNLLGVIALLMAMLPMSTALAAPGATACDNRTNNTYAGLLEWVRVEGVREHQAAFQEIAHENGGNRAAGTSGYDASVAYVVEVLEAAGWEVELDVFDFEYFPPAVLEQLTPITATYETGTFTNSGTGDVTGSVIPVDINLVPPRASTSGYEDSDFAGLDFSGPNDIALIQRGTCVFAELEGENDDNVVMAGAHLDSVPAGPGINDNGSGSAALLVAEALGKLKPENTLRFAWWGAEEAGLVGSTAYVAGLSQAERDRIALYLNFDMVGSPNYIFMVYDGDESGFPAPPGMPIPEGSIAIEDVFESYYTLVGEPYDDARFSGRSDYQAFILADIPSGGLFTGAEQPKSAEQAAIWGGTVGAQLDPCYHIACDTYDNVSLHALDVNVDAIAFAILTYAYSTQTVNGVEGQKVPGHFIIPAPAGPEGSGAGGGPRGPPMAA